MVKNAAAVCIVASFLAFIHTEIDSKDWVESLAYPAVAVLCGTCLLTIVITRFRDHISDTHDARWLNRHRDSSKGE